MLVNDPQWYKDAVIYEVHVRAFCDAVGDGYGDFRGLSSKLDYLQDLGVTAIWLLPFYPSPLRDDGYDIADYTSINPQYGTLEHFREFLDQAQPQLEITRLDSAIGLQLGEGVSTPISLAIASRWAMRFSVAGWVENRLSPPRFMPGTI